MSRLEISLLQAFPIFGPCFLYSSTRNEVLWSFNLPLRRMRVMVRMMLGELRA